jgi:hypothetical protein
LIAKQIIVHCTASNNGAPYPASQIDLDHKARGFNRIGYHLVIQPSGEVERGRGLNEQGAHCEGENDDSIGIALVGLDKFTEAQWDALRYQIDGIFRVYSTIPKWNLSCHYLHKSAQAQGKTCPNIPITNLLCWYFTGCEKAISSYKLVKE